MRFLALALLAVVTPAVTEAQALRGKAFALDGLRPPPSSAAHA